MAVVTHQRGFSACAKERLARLFRIRRPQWPLPAEAARLARLRRISGRGAPYEGAPQLAPSPAARRFVAGEPGALRIVATRSTRRAASCRGFHRAPRHDIGTSVEDPFVCSSLSAARGASVRARVRAARSSIPAEQAVAAVVSALSSGSPAVCCDHRESHTRRWRHLR